MSVCIYQVSLTWFLEHGHPFLAQASSPPPSLLVLEFLFASFDHLVSPLGEHLLQSRALLDVELGHSIENVPAAVLVVSAHSAHQLLVAALVTSRPERKDGKAVDYSSCTEVHRILVTVASTIVKATSEDFFCQDHHLLLIELAGHSSVDGVHEHLSPELSCYLFAGLAFVSVDDHGSVRLRSQHCLETLDSGGPESFLVEGGVDKDETKRTKHVVLLEVEVGVRERSGCEGEYMLTVELLQLVEEDKVRLVKDDQSVVVGGESTFPVVTRDNYGQVFFMGLANVHHGGLFCVE